MAIAIETRNCCRNTVYCGRSYVPYCMGCKTPRWFSYDVYYSRICQYSNITVTVLTHNIQHQTSQPKPNTSLSLHSRLLTCPSSPTVTTQNQHLSLSVLPSPNLSVQSHTVRIQIITSRFLSQSSQDQKCPYRQVHLKCNMSRTKIPECSTKPTILPPPPAPTPLARR
jgi:hypothetical protein